MLDTFAVQLCGRPTVVVRTLCVVVVSATLTSVVSLVKRVVADAVVAAVSVLFVHDCQWKQLEYGVERC
jgi:hypothetical protein